MENREHILTEHFDKIIEKRFKRCFSTYFLKFFSELCPQYANEIYKTSNQSNIITRNYPLKPFQPLKTKILTQKCLSYIGPLIWDGLPDDVKLSNNVNTFKVACVVDIKLFFYGLILL